MSEFITVAEAIFLKKGIIDEEVLMVRLYQYFMKSYGMTYEQISILDWREAMLFQELDKADRLERENK